MNKLASIIIRTKDEERWITQCLQSVFSQAYENIEVIIVDNESSDKTIEKAGQFKLAKIITCKEYLPGKALNMGIREAKGKYIACLSGHCVPTDEHWLDRLIRNFADNSVAGVYGRQEPMAFTPDSDKRDLALVFGLDRKVQEKDSFFHNANSVVRRDIWEKIPFSETATNIEDRIWAKGVLAKRYKIVYEPDASVYHYHGIHQNGDAERCSNVVRIMENIHPDYGYKSIDLKKLNIIALIPVRGPACYLSRTPLLHYTIKRAKESRYINTVIVSTDDEKLAGLARELGAETPFLRDASLSKENVDLGKVYQYSMRRIEELGIFPDLVVCLETTFPFRPEGLLDDMIMQLAQNGLDSVIAAKRENKGIWKERHGEIVQLDEGITPREFKDPTFVEVRGIGCVTHPAFIRSGSLLGKKIGIYELNNPYSHLEVRSEADAKMAAHLIKEWAGE